jgi:PAS domain S-box-containing protein
MGLHTATALNRWAKRAEERTLYAGRLNIGPRLILGFVFIILSMLAADAVILWQFHVVRTQAGRLNDVGQKLVAVLRVHTSLLAFHDRLDVLADAEDADRLLTEAGPLRTAVLEDIRRATSALNLPPFDPRRDPSILPTLHAIQSALPSQIEAITTLATSRDWRAVHLRLENQVRPLESLTSELVEKVDHEVGEEQVQTVLNIKRVQRLVFLIVPLTAFVTLLVAATLGVAITRSITRPLARLVEGSKALARGEFQHQVSVSGNDELARLSRVFNDTASRLRVLYATLQSSEDRLRLVIDTIPAHAWSTRPDGSVDFINRRFLEFTGRSMEDMLGWGWGSVIHPDDLTEYVEAWGAAVAMGEPMESEIRVRREDGDYRWLLIRNVPLRDELGNIVNWYGTAIDIEERKRAEETLRRSEAYLAEAQRLSHTGSFGWKPSTGEINWSEETFRIFRYDPLTIPTVELILQRVDPEDASSFKETVARASQDGKDFEHEHRLVMPDGAVKHLHVVAHAEGDESGQIKFVGAVMDVTDRKRAQEALRQSEAYLAEAQRLSHTGSWAWKVGTSRQYWSVETFRIYGFDQNTTEPTRENFLRRVHPDDQASIELVETELYKGNDAEYNYRVILPDGSIKYIRSVARAVCKDSGQVIEFVGTVMDVTERKLAEALRDGESRILEMIARDAPLKETLEKLVLLVEAQFADLICSVLLLDEDGQHMHPGAAPNLPTDYTQAIDGMCIGPKAGSSGTAMYRRETVVVTDILQDPLWESYRDAAEPYGLRACWSIPILAHSGEPLGSFTMYYPEPRGPSPAETRALEMATHLAGIAIERKLAGEERERLRQAQMELAHVNRVTTMGELTASLAHEVNQPIGAAVTSANSCLRWLAGDVPNLNKARAAAERIVKDGTRAAEIISRIRLLFQKSALQLESVDVNEVIEEMTVLLRGEAMRYSISLRTELAPALPPVMGDRVQLQQVMMNLMINGIDAMKALDGTRELTIKSQRAENEQLLVSVSDTGVGLPPGQADHIFNAFFTTKPHGTGMGLRICRSIVESHGGRLWAASNSPRGASFSLTLPANLEAQK